MKTYLVKEARLAVKVKGWDRGTIAALKKLFSKDNPKFWTNRAMGFSNWKVDAKIKSWELEDDWLMLPREVGSILKEFLKERNIKIVRETDKTVTLDPIKFELKFPLYPYQEIAVNNLINGSDGGIIRGPCGSGKSVILLGYIARINQPTLVVVHSGALLQQWKTAVIEWLDFVPGTIGGGKKDNIRPITIAMQQSLYKRTDATWLNDFGALIGDECLKAGAMILMEDRTEKPIEEIFFGDKVAFGGKVLNTMKRKYEGKLYALNDCYYTPEHPIFTTRGYVPISEITRDHNILFCGKIISNLQICTPMIIKKQKVIVYNFETENGVYVAGNILVHNCHRWGAKTFQHVGTFFPAKYRVGASADEKRKDKLEHLIYETFGEVVHEIKKSELESLGRLVPVRIDVVPTGYFDLEYLDFIEQGIAPNWLDMNSALVLDQDRNGIILAKLISVLKESKSNRILMLTNLIKSVDYWIEKVRSLNIKIGKMIGGTHNKEELEDSIIDLKSGDIRVAIGTSVADEGLDIPPLTHVFLLCPMHKNPKRMNQMMGRTARRYKDKVEGVCVYFWDENMFPIRRRESSDKEQQRKQVAFIKKLRKLESEKCEK